MTKQEMFNRVWEYFIGDSSTFKSLDGGNSYAPNGMGVYSCAVGLLMPQDLYKPEMDEYAFQLVTKMFPKVAIHFGEDNIWFLAKLQELHDTSDSREEFAHELIDLAKAYELSVPTPEDAEAN